MKSDPRPVVRCARCNLVQFVTRSGVCRRCLAVLPEGEKPAPREKITQCAKRVTGGDGGAGKRAQAVRFIREQFELTQGEMAVYCGLRGHSAIAHLEHAPEGREVSWVDCRGDLLGGGQADAGAGGGDSGGRRGNF